MKRCARRWMSAMPSSRSKVRTSCLPDRLAELARFVVPSHQPVPPGTPQVVRRRRIVAVVTLVVGTALARCRAHAPRRGAPAFYVLAAVLAGVWLLGGLALGSRASRSWAHRAATHRLAAARRSGSRSGCSPSAPRPSAGSRRCTTRSTTSSSAPTPVACAHRRHHHRQRHRRGGVLPRLGLQRVRLTRARRSGRPSCYVVGHRGGAATSCSSLPPR